MRHPIIMAVLCLLLSLTANAQFHTIKNENETPLLSKDPFLCQEQALDTSAKLVQNKPENNYKARNQQVKANKKCLELHENDTKTVHFSMLNMSDSLLLGLIKKRLSICMPLDWIYLTSAYGYRRDPFVKCKRFHDGIDLRCNEKLVYTMLQGKVEKVVYGNNGYGNHVITQHGNLKFLYGHLSEIYVKEGDTVDAGKIIARSGNSGSRSTGPHLHLQMKRLDGDVWKSVNPEPFIEALNNYIVSIDNELAKFTGSDMTKQDERLSLTKENLYAVLKKYGVKHPKIVLAQAILETGWFSSQVCKERNNLFGLRHSKGYYSFDHWEESVEAYVNWVQYKYNGSDNNPSQYYAFLKKIGYASAKDYTNKVRAIAEQL